ncbi:MAG: ABC-type transport auxiliary lipoprotein family protein [Sphingomonas sp.]
MRNRFLVLLLAVSALSGCFGGGRAAQLLTLTPSASRPTATPRSAAQGAAITIVEPTVPQALRTTRIPVYVSETSIQYLEHAVWVENPGPLFARLLSETVTVRTGRVVLDSRQYSQDPGTRVTGQLHQFGLDPARMEAVIVYDATMPRGGGVVTNRFEARISVAEATPAAVAPALNQAANQIADQVAAWIGG